MILQARNLGFWAVIMLLTGLSAILSGCAGVSENRDSYIDFIRVDEHPPMVESAPGADSLLGSAGESAEGDGIAESRREELEALVRRFAPTLVLPRSDEVDWEGKTYRLLPTRVQLFADTLRLDVIRTAPYEMRTWADYPFHSLSSDSLAKLVDSARRYWAGPQSVTTSYFNFPGSRPTEWWAAYARFRAGPDSVLWGKPTVYAHPFRDTQGRTVLQYWYFYPFNDHILNHEGDWEHINVVPSADQTRVEEVHYFFHHRSVKLPQNQFLPRIADGTHPVVYVGGRAYNVFDYPVRMVLKESNEGSHGCYPYPGEWEGAASLGTPESVAGEDGETTRILPHESFDVVLTPEPSLIDYHRVPEVLQEWAWLLLPVRWGFPTAPSLGSSVKFTEVGNTAPFGPAFNTGWNRDAHGLLYPAFQIRQVPKVQSYVEDLLQPWYYLYIFRTPRYVHDPRGLMTRSDLERLGLAPRGGWREAGFGTTILGMHVAWPDKAASGEYQTSVGFLLWRNFWAKVRRGGIEILGGYQKFATQPPADGSLFVYPLALNLVIRAPDAHFRPYASLGAGAYGWQTREKLSGDLGILTRSGWEFGWTAAAGVEYYLRSRVALDVNVRYHATGISGSEVGVPEDHVSLIALWIGHYVRF